MLFQVVSTTPPMSSFLAPPPTKGATAASVPPSGAGAGACLLSLDLDLGPAPEPAIVSPHTHQRQHWGTCRPKGM